MKLLSWGGAGEAEGAADTKDGGRTVRDAVAERKWLTERRWQERPDWVRLVGHEGVHPPWWAPPSCPDDIPLLGIRSSHGETNRILWSDSV